MPSPPPKTQDIGASVIQPSPPSKTQDVDPWLSADPWQSSRGACENRLPQPQQHTGVPVDPWQSSRWACENRLPQPQQHTGVPVDPWQSSRGGCENRPPQQHMGVPVPGQPLQTPSPDCHPAASSSSTPPPMDCNRNGARTRPDARPGDWYCPNCHDMNFASRLQCRKCGAPKTGGNAIECPAGSGRDTRSFRQKWGEDDPRRGRGRAQFNFLGERLDKINWNGIEIVPVRKAFDGVLHPNVEQLSADECETIRLRHGIVVESLTDYVEEVPKPIERLEEHTFPEWMFDIIRQRGWKDPFPIQIQAWPIALRGHDVLAVAQTGSGKTMAYVLPMLVHVIAQTELKPGEGPVGLTILPNRELCKQVAGEFQKFAQDMGLKCEAIFGGEKDQERQRTRMIERVDIMVATPGRLIELLEMKATNLLRATYVVLDEADQLLSEGFERQISYLLTQIRPDRQVLLFSATWPDEVEQFARRMCTDRPMYINVGNIKLAACKDVLQHFWCEGHGEGAVADHMWRRQVPKIEVLKKAVQTISELMQDTEDKALIFCNDRSEVPRVADALQQAGYACEGFSGEQTQRIRDEIFQRFKEGDLQILVSTQVLGRGQDFHNVKYVINYDMPIKLVDYVHRIGRTGRAGRQGFSLTLLEETDLRFAKQLVDMLKETAQAVPPWLDKEYNKGKHWRKVYSDRRDAQKATQALTDRQGAEAPPSAGPTPALASAPAPALTSVPPLPRNQLPPPEPSAPAGISSSASAPAPALTSALPSPAAVQKPTPEPPASAGISSSASIRDCSPRSFDMVFGPPKAPQATPNPPQPLVPPGSSCMASAVPKATAAPPETLVPPASRCIASAVPQAAAVPLQTRAPSGSGCIASAVPRAAATAVPPQTRAPPTSAGVPSSVPLATAVPAACEGRAPQREGQKVMIQGVQAMPKLNGCLGITTKWDLDTKRWHVKFLTAEGEVKSLKPENLMCVIEAPESPEWKGRGRSSCRAKHLALLQGRGIARVAGGRQ